MASARFIRRLFDRLAMASTSQAARRSLRVCGSGLSVVAIRGVRSAPLPTAGRPTFRGRDQQQRHGPCEVASSASGAGDPPHEVPVRALVDSRAIPAESS
jgi:hypothetical protein